MSKNFTPYGTNEKLDRMVNNEEWRVRKAVASQGYGLDILINDKDYDVWHEVIEYLDANGYKNIKEWREKTKG